MLLTRLSTAIIALPATLAVIIFAPPAAFDAFIFLLTLWGLYEIGDMTRAAPVQWMAIAVTGVLPAMATMRTAPTSWIAAVLVFFLMLGLIVRVGIGGAESVPRGILLTVIGAAWVGVLFPYFALLRNSTNGVAFVIVMLLLVVASDSGAYFAGRFVGRIKLLPRVSPNKTVEGAIGGLATCVGAVFILRPALIPGLPVVSAALLAIGIGVLAQIGDLANSAYKRVAGVKDSGWIFPGHGGLLDRTCSLVFAAVLTYYCLR